MPEQTQDPELQAIEQVVKALSTLDTDARTRVVTYVFQRLGLSQPTQLASQPVTVSQNPASTAQIQPAPTHGAHIADIRTLKDAKQPKSDNQMAALVAYYLKDVAPAADRKDAISHEDIEKYFKQAGFPLPKQIRMPLNNAKNAGYFDSAGSGLFRLNPVGHNLVVHGMPSGAGDTNRRARLVSKPKATKKPSK